MASRVEQAIVRPPGSVRVPAVALVYWRTAAPDGALRTWRASLPLPPVKFTFRPRSPLTVSVSAPGGALPTRPVTPDSGIVRVRPPLDRVPPAGAGANFSAA